jgi:hypothetical protein
MSNRNWQLSPSDFAFLWDECKRCFYLKIVENFQRPHSIMPKIFTIIDSQMKAWSSGKRTIDLVTGLPQGVVAYSDKWVESEPITIPRHSSSCVLRGKFDTVLKLDDGSYAVVDLKTSETRAEHVSKYSRQLHAYAWALENAIPGKLALSPITSLGLLVFEPASFSSATTGATELTGSLNWIEMPRDDTTFLEFLADVVDVLEQPSPPGGSASCEWCQYRDTSRRTGL